MHDETVHKKRTYYFRCESNDERAAWALAIKHAFTPPEAAAGAAVSDHFREHCDALAAFYAKHNPGKSQADVDNTIAHYVSQGGAAGASGGAPLSPPSRPGRGAAPFLASGPS